MSLRSHFTLHLPTTGPQLIAVGLAGLLASALVPAVPVVTAMALLTLGATDATLARFRESPALVPIVLLHAATYATLYVLFLGAMLHAASQGLTAWAVVDLTASTIPMALAMQRIGRRVRQRISPGR